MIEKLISGAQQGADLGGLLVAEEFGIPMGGHCPKNCRTENGDHPEYITRFGLQETTSRDYPPRTRLNVYNSDGTVIFCSKARMSSPGTKLTRKLARELGKPCVIVLFVGPESFIHVEALVQWIREKNIHTLNVAGSRESKCPGIQLYTQIFLTCVFKALTDASNYKQ